MLALGLMRSELRALSSDSQLFHPGRNWSDVTFLLDPLFLAKNQPADLPPPPADHQSGVILGSGDDDLLLCPFRAIRFYRSRMLPHCCERCRFFLPTVVAMEAEVSPATVSLWCCKVVHDAYASADQLYSVHGHDMYVSTTLG